MTDWTPPAWFNADDTAAEADLVARYRRIIQRVREGADLLRSDGDLFGWRARVGMLTAEADADLARLDAWIAQRKEVVG